MPKLTALVQRGGEREPRRPRGGRLAGHAEPPVSIHAPMKSRAKQDSLHAALGAFL